MNVDAEIFRKYVGDDFSGYIPSTKKQALKLVKHLLVHASEMYACPKDHYMFPDTPPPDDDPDHNPVCGVIGCNEHKYRTSRSGTKCGRRILHYWSLADRLTRMWGNKKIARLMHWWFHQARDRGDNMTDFMDGKAFRDVFQVLGGDSANSVAGVVCSDGVQAWKRGESRSIEAIVVKFVTLPPWLQAKKGLLFIWGFPPPNSKIAIYMDAFSKHCGELASWGLHVWDAFQQKICLTRFFLMFSTNDKKGKVKLVAGADVGSKKHSCCHCDVTGFRVKTLGATITCPRSVIYLTVTSSKMACSAS